ncbi:MAG: response regulator transcription factor [Chloroflexi bacterium]|nr:response regulator transcription factor [Chloroflexota bacterium]
MANQNKATVLVVDDAKSLREFVRRNLDVRGYRVVTAVNGVDALEKFQAHDIDLVILDLIMPQMDGLEVIKQLRLISNVPIIVLSALGEETTKIQALNRGADDYLTKPFGVGELLARVQAVLRRAQPTTSTTQPTVIVRGPIVLDRERHEVTIHGKPVALTPTEFNLLEYLMRNAGKVLSHSEILRHVWGPEYGQEAEYLRVYIGRLRQKIEPDPNNPRYLRTERGVGYAFEA